MISKLSVFMAELKRRKVARAVVGYVLAGFAVIEGVGLLQPTLRFSERLYDFSVILVLLGLPVVLVLSWFVEVTSDGLRRTPPASPEALAAHSPTRWTVGSWILTGVGALLVAAGAYLAYGWASGLGLQEDRVVVFPFDNLTGDSGFDDLGMVVAHRIAGGLTLTGEFDVVAPDEVQQAAQSEADGATSMQIARSFGAGTVVTGVFTRVGDQLLFQADIRRLRTGFAVRGAEARGPASRRGAMQGIDALRDDVMGALAIAGADEETTYWVDRAFSYEAYLPYLRADQSWLAGEFQDAARSYQEAYRADTTFLLALLSAASSLQLLQDWAGADSILTQVEDRRAEMSTAHQMWLDWLNATRRGDLQGTLDVTRLQVAHDPEDEVYRAFIGYGALDVGRVQEAVGALESVSRENDVVSTWPYFWIAMAQANHLLGRFQRELEAARDAMERLPGEALLFRRDEARALTALGRLTEVDAILTAVERLEATWDTTPGDVLRGIAGDLARSGHPAASVMAAERAAESYASMGAAAPRTTVAESYLLAGRIDEARVLLLEVIEEEPDNLPAHGLLGVALALAGDREGAEGLAAWCDELDRPFLRGAHALWRAAILAQLGRSRDAVIALRQAHHEGVSFVILRSSPWLLPLRGYAAYERLVALKR